MNFDALRRFFQSLLGAGRPGFVDGAQFEFPERAQMERQLHERDEIFSKVFQVSPVAISITRLSNGTLMEANQAFWKLTGLDPETSIGSTTVDLKLWGNQEARQEFIRKILERKSLSNPDYEFPNERGGKRVVAAFHELIDRGDEPTVLSMFYDQTEQKLAQQALERSEARTRALLDATPDMLFEFDRDGTIVQFVPSSTIEPLLPPDEFLGKNINQVIPPVVAEQTMFAIGRTLESGQLHVFEYQLSSDGKVKTFEARVIKSDLNRVMAIVRDITMRKWVEAERENLIEELELKNAELERFTYTVSHDLKSPLFTIRGFVGFLKEDVQKGDMERVEKDIQRIVNATDKMHELLGDLLELSRIGRLINEPENVPFNELISETIELLHGRITQGGIRMVVMDDLPTVHVDRQRIFEVLQNLIDNAAKFIGNQPAPEIEIGQKGVIDNMPVFYIRDNGMGIAPEFNETIFGLFNKLDSQTEGTGIGLALVKRIVEFHGGRVWVESELGRGTTFLFTLPTQPKPAR
jgi:PAS domain S-box-containing protein